MVWVAGRMNRRQKHQSHNARCRTQWWGLEEAHAVLLLYLDGHVPPVSARFPGQAWPGLVRGYGRTESDCRRGKARGVVCVGVCVVPGRRQQPPAATSIKISRIILEKTQRGIEAKDGGVG